jgi:hypothetical protein
LLQPEQRLDFFAKSLYNSCAIWSSNCNA